MLDFNNLLIRKVIILLLKDFDLNNYFQNSSSINRKLRAIKSTKSLFLLQLFEEKSIPIHGLDLFLFSRSYFYTSSLPFVLLRHSFVLLAFITYIDKQNRFRGRQKIPPGQPEAKLANQTVCKICPILRGLMPLLDFTRQIYHSSYFFTTSRGVSHNFVYVIKTTNITVSQTILQPQESYRFFCLFIVKCSYYDF